MTGFSILTLDARGCKACQRHFHDARKCIVLVEKYSFADGTFHRPFHGDKGAHAYVIPQSWERPVLQVELLPSKRTGEVKVSMRSFTPRIIENGTADREDKKCGSNTKLSDTKPSIQSYHLKAKRISPGYSMNDLDKLTVNRKLPNLSMENLKSILKNSDMSYLDNGDICKHDIGGSAPDFKKIFVTEFIWNHDAMWMFIKTEDCTVRPYDVTAYQQMIDNLLCTTGKHSWYRMYGNSLIGDSFVSKKSCWSWNSKEHVIRAFRFITILIR